MPDGLAEAVEAAIANYAGRQRKTSRSAVRKRIDEKLRRLVELYTETAITREEYATKKADLLIERDALESAPATASLAIQRQRITAVVEDWPKMTGEEKKRMLAMIFREIRADHTGTNGNELVLAFRPLPHGEPYVDAVLAREKTATESGSDPVSTSERKTGLEPATLTLAR